MGGIAGEGTWPKDVTRGAEGNSGIGNHMVTDLTTCFATFEVTLGMGGVSFQFAVDKELVKIGGLSSSNNRWVSKDFLDILI